jgi:membrane-bound lytic murein transglycosylase D
MEPGAQLLPPAQVAKKARKQAPPSDVWERIRRQLQLHTLHNARIGAEREHYLAQSRYIDLVAPRAQLYLYYLVAEVEQRDMPIEIALLPLVESALDPLARSPQGAAGLWQFMPGTADHLGMRRDWWFDARLDLRASTGHALDYLESLHEDFDGDWLLALAAYNSGKARVRRAVARNQRAGKPSDFWSLDLPRETRRYVPRLVALSTLIALTGRSGWSYRQSPTRLPWSR